MKNIDTYKTILDDNTTYGCCRSLLTVDVTDDNTFEEDDYWYWSNLHIGEPDKSKLNILAGGVISKGSGWGECLYTRVFWLGALYRIRNKLRKSTNAPTYAECVHMVLDSVCETQERLHWLCDRIEHERVNIICSVETYNCHMSPDLDEEIRLKYFPYECISFDRNPRVNTGVSFELPRAKGESLGIVITQTETQIRKLCSDLKKRHIHERLNASKVVDMAYILSINEVL